MQIQAQHKKLNAMKLRRQVGVYALLLLIGLGPNQPIRAREAHSQAAQMVPAKEAIEVSFDSRAEEENAAVTKLMVQRRDYQSILSQLARPQPSVGSFDSWQPVPVWLITPNTSQARAGKKNKKAGVLIGMLGLSLAGAGVYLTATSREEFSLSPAPVCLDPFRPCVSSPQFRTIRLNQGRFYGGIGLAVAGVGLSVVGFRNMR